MGSIDTNSSLNLGSTPPEIAKRFEQTRELIQPHTIKTPCKKSDGLSLESSSEVFLKLENKQVTGSFKMRGAISKVLSLSEKQRGGKLVAASTGNHGAAFGHVVKELGLDGVLFVPTTITPVKLEFIQTLGVEVVKMGSDCVDTEVAASNYARENGFVFVGPYNDIDVVLGQGTVGVEILEQLGEVDVVLVPVGGGGLISGIATYLKHASPDTKIVGCQPLNSKVMYESIRAGEILDMESLPTLSDATAGGVESGSITFSLCKAHVDEFIILNEDEIASAIRFVYHNEKMTIEGGAALSVAAAIKNREAFRGKRIVAIISGGKIDPSVLKIVLGMGG